VGKDVSFKLRKLFVGGVYVGINHDFVVVVNLADVVVEIDENKRKCAADKHG
jgi:hypothetical protein